MRDHGFPQARFVAPATISRWRGVTGWPLLRSSGFRLTLRSLALSLAGAVLVFGIIHRAAEHIWRGQLDNAVRGAMSDILGDIGRDGKGVAWNVTATIHEGGGLFFADLAPDGRLLAGNFAPPAGLLRGAEEPWTLHRGQGLRLPRHVLAVRAAWHRFPDGQTLVIAANASPLLALNALLARSFLSVFGVILALGLLNGYLAARAASRRVDGFATAIAEIMAGDLSRRMPSGAAGDEFDRLAEAVNAMLRRLAELMENLRQVTNDISHDLRSPLARLREHLELSHRRFDTPELRPVFAGALAQIDQALDIFAAMLRIAEVEAGERRRYFAPLALSDLLETLADSFEPAFAAAGIKFEAAIAPDLMFFGDRELLQQMLANLLDNVILHAKAGRTGLEAARSGGGITIEVADDGIGIPAAQQPRMFERFTRMDQSRNRPGYGLGLALAAAIAGLHGGGIALGDNHPGLRAVIRLPEKEAGASFKNPRIRSDYL